MTNPWRLFRKQYPFLEKSVFHRGAPEESVQGELQLAWFSRLLLGLGVAAYSGVRLACQPENQHPAFPRSLGQLQTGKSGSHQMLVEQEA